MRALGPISLLSSLAPDSRGGESRSDPDSCSWEGSEGEHLEVEVGGTDTQPLQQFGRTWA